MCRIKLYNNIYNRNIIYIIIRFNLWKVVELTLRMINCGIKESIKGKENGKTILRASIGYTLYY